MSLASLTQATHQNAERTEFAREMMSGKMSNDKYTKFLWNAWLIYDLLEDVAMSMGVFASVDPQMPADDLPLDGLVSADEIMEDFKELGGDPANPPAMMAMVDEYRSHIVKSIQHDKKKLTAHIWAWHYNDLEKANDMKGKVPGSGKMWSFANMRHSIEEMKGLLDRRVDDDDEIEVNIANGYKQKLYDQLNG